MLGARRGTWEESLAIVLVGEWTALDALRMPGGGCAEILRCPARPRALQRLLREFDATSWLLVGRDQNDDAIDALARSMRIVRPDCCLAMLGSRYDWPRCERWLRRGCAVYLEDSSGIDRVLAVLVAVRRTGIMAVDSCFLEEVRRQVPIDSTEPLTRRERDVLQLVRNGLSNRHIAAELQVSENTIEFHMTNLLGKLAARNRLEAVERARALGI